MARLNGSQSLRQCRQIRHTLSLTRSLYLADDEPAITGMVPSSRLRCAGAEGSTSLMGSSTDICWGGQQEGHRCMQDKQLA